MALIRCREQQQQLFSFSRYHEVLISQVDPLYFSPCMFVAALSPASSRGHTQVLKVHAQGRHGMEVAQQV